MRCKGTLYLELQSAFLLSMRHARSGPCSRSNQRSPRRWKKIGLKKAQIRANALVGAVTALETEGKSACCTDLSDFKHSFDVIVISMTARFGKRDAEDFFQDRLLLQEEVTFLFQFQQYV